MQLKLAALQRRPSRQLACDMDPAVAYDILGEEAGDRSRGTRARPLKWLQKGLTKKVVASTPARSDTHGQLHDLVSSAAGVE